MSNISWPDTPVMRDLANAKETVWINPNRVPFSEAKQHCVLSLSDILDADARLRRFAPFIRTCFPETAPQDGLIESDLIKIPNMRNALYPDLAGCLLLKKDSHLAIAGSIKARGGIYEVLKHTEDLAFAHGLLTESDDYAILAGPDFRDFFHQHTIQVGSTGNLGMSIGIMSAAIGYKVIVHMSADAKQWKKDLLRSHGVTVMEYESDYSEAVRQGRAQSDADPMSYFVDDENSTTLFLGYAVSALRLKDQLETLQIPVDPRHPLFVYLPCGVGGAPGGVAFGLKQLFGDSVHCFFVEPTQAPCMTAGMASGLNNKICVQDLGLTGLTEADGLAVGRASGFVGSVMEPLLSGCLTVDDVRLLPYLKALYLTESVFIEPSSCAAFHGPVRFTDCHAFRCYLDREGLSGQEALITHLCWATGGALVPETIRKKYMQYNKQE